jgi:transcriptional regulator with XRE-family HTH domain
MIRPAQIRAARSLLGISQNQLSELADVGISTIKRIELAPEVSGSARTLLKLEEALERGGVEFIPAGEGKGPGVRLSQEEASAPDYRRR